MDSLIAQYRQIIEKTFQDYADFLDTDLGLIRFGFGDQCRGSRHNLGMFFQ